MIKKFKLGGREYKVIEKKMDSSSLGLCNVPMGLITLQTKWDGEDIPEDSKEATMFHEIVHAILDEMGKTELSQDEVFVQGFSALMYQFWRTAK